MTAKKKDPAANNGKNGAGAYPLLPLRKRAVPIIAIETADPQATQDSCVSILDADAPALSWDMVRGAQGINAAGKAWTDENIDEAAKLTLLNITEALAWFRNNAPRRALLIIHNGHLLLKNAQGEPILSSIQATWNCRDVFASRGATLVMLAPQWKLPTELAQDVVVISEPVPTDDDILKIVDSLNTDAEFPEETLKAIDRQKALDGLTGYLSAFSVRQSYSIALNNTGPDYAKLWELKVQSLRQTAGLEITLPKITFNDMAGNEGVKAIIRRHLAGTEAPRAILWLDEIEKMLAASGSDLSGTTQAVLEQYLFWTQSRKVKGFLLAGIPGAGKSLTCQAVAGEANCPLLRASLSTVKGGIVGATEANTAKLFKAVDAVGQGRVLMLATCNSLEALSPEVMSRYQMGMFFYDYPNAEEKQSIVSFYRARYSIPEADEMPDCRNWVGREIEACFEKAAMWKISLKEAAESVVPAAIANKDKLERLRRDVSGRFLSASRPGIYSYEDPQKAEEFTAKRRLDLSN